MKSFYGRRCVRGVSADFLLETKDNPVYFEANSAKKKISTFCEKYNNITLEIGFGMGHHMIFQAKNFANKGIIGCDPFINGNLNVMKSARHYLLQNLMITNLDFLTLFNFVKKIKFSEIFIFFPDPWNKRRQKKRRLVNFKMTVLLSEILEKNGKVNIITDDKDYWEQIIMYFSLNQRFSFSKKFNKLIAHDFKLFRTKYFKKAKEKSKQTYFNSFKLIR